MAKKPAQGKSVKITKSVPTKVKKVTKSSKSQKLPVKKAIKSKPAKKTASRITKSSVKKSPASKITTAKAPKPPKATKKAAQPSGPKGYTASEYQKFLTEKKRLNGCTNQELKDTLRKNLQSMSGNKDELVEKVADGIVLGRIPRCPKCFGGRPKFDFKKGTYYCSGYRDDEDFKNCHSTF